MNNVITIWILLLKTAGIFVNFAVKCSSLMLCNEMRYKSSTKRGHLLLVTVWNTVQYSDWLLTQGIELGEEVSWAAADERSQQRHEHQRHSCVHAPQSVVQLICRRLLPQAEVAGIRGQVGAQHCKTSKHQNRLQDCGLALFYSFNEESTIGCCTFIITNQIFKSPGTIQK